MSPPGTFTAASPAPPASWASPPRLLEADGPPQYRPVQSGPRPLGPGALAVARAGPARPVRRRMCDADTLPGRNNLPGATPSSGCDGGTPIAPQTVGFAGVAPGTTGGAIPGRPLVPQDRSVQQGRGAALPRSGRRDVIRGVTGGHRPNHTRARRIEAATVARAGSKRSAARRPAPAAWSSAIRRSRGAVAEAGLVEACRRAWPRGRRACAAASSQPAGRTRDPFAVAWSSMTRWLLRFLLRRGRNYRSSALGMR